MVHCMEISNEDKVIMWRGRVIGKRDKEGRFVPHPTLTLGEVGEILMEMHDALEKSGQDILALVKSIGQITDHPLRKR